MHAGTSESAPRRQPAHSVRAARSALRDLGLDDLDDGGLGERAEVAELVALAGDDLAHDAAHDLARARLGQVGHDEDLLRRREGPDDLAHLQHELLDEVGFVGGVVLELSGG